MYVDENRQGEQSIPVQLEPWRQVLLNAANQLESKGWCQNMVRDKEGRMCAVGAIANQSALYGEAILVLQKFVGGSVVSWNNAPTRTKEEVVTAMRTCARQEL